MIKKSTLYLLCFMKKKFMANFKEKAELLILFLQTGALY